MRAKRILLPAALLLALLLSACGPVVDTAPAETPAPEATAAPTPAPAATPEPTPEPTPVPLDEQARELLRAGDYEAAAALLESVPDDPELDTLRLLAALGSPAVGDRVVFGSYEQDDETENGAEPIEWIVLDAADGRVLLLSARVLDTRPYHTADTAVNWAECELRAWLNGEFLETAFTEAERALLFEAELENEDNPDYGAPGCENTFDRVFLLSIQEAKRYLDEYELRLAPVTDYAMGRCCFLSASGYGWWWLRSPGVYSRDAAYIDPIGAYYYYGYVVNRPGWSVRPAVWLDLGC